MSKPEEQVRDAARMALQVKTVAYRLMTVEPELRMDFARFFLDEFCAGLRATEADAELLLECVAAGFAPVDYFADPVYGEARPINIPFAVFQSVVNGYCKELFEPAFDRCDLYAVDLRVRKYLLFFGMVHCPATPLPLTEEEVDEFMTLSVDIMPCLRDSITRSELAALLGIRGFV
ncbi:MAG: hypothetical protein J0I12_07380 [Candidatus Eremiobacteraeota bacterium]|nr:hypothetical protein [Candidatus Eremiobacteraeota bacterium]